MSRKPSAVDCYLVTARSPRRLPPLQPIKILLINLLIWLKSSSFRPFPLAHSPLTCPLSKNASLESPHGLYHPYLGSEQQTKGFG